MPPAWRGGQALAEQYEAPQRHEQRGARLHQQAVDRGRILQGVIGDRVVTGEAGEREQRHHPGMLADRGPVACEMQRGEGQQDQERAAPADACKRQRRDVSGADAAHDRIAGPKQRRQGQQEIRLIEQPAALSAARIGICSRHQCASPCPNVPRVGGFLAASELSWTADKDQCAYRMVPSRFCRSVTTAGAGRGNEFPRGAGQNFRESKSLMPI